MSTWYIYENEEVLGPYNPEDLTDYLEEDTLVCRAGEKEWQEAGNVPELANILTDEAPGDGNKSRQKTTEDPLSGQTKQNEPKETTSDDEEEIIEPTLKNFLEICEGASDNDLLNEYESNFQEYDAQEKQILVDELQRRNLIEST